MRFFAVIFCFISFTALAQQDSLSNILKEKTDNFFNRKATKLKLDSFKPIKPKPVATIKKDTTQSIVITRVDTLIKKDSIVKITVDTTISSLVKHDGYNILKEHPILSDAPPEMMLLNLRNPKSNDSLFYVLLGIVFILSFVQVIFPKYLRNIFDIFFQPGFRQRQTRDQISQEYIAAFIVNFLFILSTSVFISLSSQFNKSIQFNFWRIFLLSIIALSSIYIIKFLFTRFMGWVFNKEEIATSYNFLVFLINKIIGVVLIPSILLISYASIELQLFALNTSIIIIAFLLLYRFVKAIGSLSRLLKINVFHFFIYFCSVEILPLALLYKAIGNYIGSGI